MFHSARLKLTGWYLLIIMLISFFFSVVIYVVLTREVERGFRRAELRFRAKELGIQLPPRFPPKNWERIDPRLSDIDPRFSFNKDLEAIKKTIAFRLLLVNGVILGISALSGYFLAGRTLRPIEKAMLEQKRFIADASHELRTPLTALKTSMEIALREKKMPLVQTRKLIKSNLEDVNQMNLLVDNLLRLASYQDNGGNFKFEKVNLKEVVKMAYKRILPLAQKKTIEVRLKTKSCFLEADKTSLVEMISVLLDNAVKYTPKGGKVTLAAFADKKHAFVEVKDTGIGIPSEEIPRIFDRFYRVDQSRSKEKVAGFGLGLSLAKRVIEIHRGSVEVKSRVGKGTTFLVKLPLKHA